MNKYTITVSYTCEANSDIEAIFALNKSLYPLSESELEKFDVVLVKEHSPLVVVQCRECGEDIESMWLEPNQITTCNDCVGA